MQALHQTVPHLRSRAERLHALRSTRAYVKRDFGCYLVRSDPGAPRGFTFVYLNGATSQRGKDRSRKNVPRWLPD